MHDEDGRPAPIRFTEEEADFLRFVRFGELPPRVMPGELVEIVETEHPWEPTQRPFEFGPGERFLG